MKLHARVSITALCREAVRAVLRHRGRSALTALGITIGVAAVVWVVAIGAAGSERVERQLQNLGDNLVWVEAGSRNVNGARTGAHGTTTLTLDDAEAMLSEVRLDQEHLASGGRRSIRRICNRNWTTRYRGVAPSYLDIKKWKIANGAAFGDDEVRSAANVCLIGQTVREQLFGPGDPVGEIVRIGVTPFRVVGVLAPKGQTATGQDQDDTIMLPYTTAQQRLRDRGLMWLDDILCSAVSAEAVAQAATQISDLLRQRHHVEQDQEDDFNIRHPEDVIQAQLETSKTFAGLLVSIASVALLVGGIGVMNVMLASVVERTREIGLRLAVGAPAWAVEVQFLAESVVLTLIGGVFGIFVSVVGSFALGEVLGWPVSIPLTAVVVAVAFSIAVGVFFGFYPARRAALLDPIEALRSD